MARSFVLGIDCKLYYMPLQNRVPATPVPDQLMDYSAYLAGGRTDPSLIEFSGATVSSYCIVKTVQDATLNLTSTTADVTNRHSNGWRQMVSAIKEGSVDFSVLWEPDDKDFLGLMEIYLGQCPAAFAICDGPLDGFTITNGACQSGDTPAGASTCQVPYAPRCGECGVVTGLHGDFIITSFTRNEGLEEGVTADVTLELGQGLIYPEWLYINPIIT